MTVWYPNKFPPTFLLQTEVLRRFRYYYIPFVLPTFLTTHLVVQALCHSLPRHSFADFISPTHVHHSLSLAQVMPFSMLMGYPNVRLPSTPCGPALRLTPSEARTVGAAWYTRKMNVREGFDTTFLFEISNPSLHCDIMDDVNTFCRSR